MSELDGVVALVTGSSRGIGAAIARLFAEAGAAVAVHGRDRQSANAVQEQITAAGGRAISVLADLTDPAQIEAALRAGATPLPDCRACGAGFLNAGAALDRVRELADTGPIAAP